MTPREIAELVYSEFSPLESLGLEEAVDRIEYLIKNACDEHHRKELAKVYNDQLKFSAEKLSTLTDKMKPIHETKPNEFAQSISNVMDAAVRGWHIHFDKDGDMPLIIARKCNHFFKIYNFDHNDLNMLVTSMAHADKKIL